MEKWEAKTQYKHKLNIYVKDGDSRWFPHGIQISSVYLSTYLLYMKLLMSLSKYKPQFPVICFCGLGFFPFLLFWGFLGCWFCFFFFNFWHYVLRQKETVRYRILTYLLLVSFPDHWAKTFDFKCFAIWPYERMISCQSDCLWKDN